MGCLSTGWRVSKLPPNGVLVATSLMLATCISIHETIDYRYGVLQSRQKPLTLKTQNQQLNLNDSHTALDRTNVANLADRASSCGTNRQAEPKKDPLATNEIQLFANLTLGIWHYFLPDATPRNVSGTPWCLLQLIQNQGQPYMVR